MRIALRSRFCTSVLAAFLIIAATVSPALAAGSGPLAAGSGPLTAGPSIKLIAAQRSIVISSSGGFAALDPGIWVASEGSAFEFKVLRSSYTQPLTITQLIHLPSGKVLRRPLPGSVLESIPLGLLDFLNLTVRNTAGKKVGSSKVLFCPNSTNPEQATPGAPPSSPYPAVCVADPFPKGMVWGIQKDWAVDPMTAYGPPLFPLSPGNYKVTESISPTYRRMFDINDKDASASVHIRVVPGTGGPARPVPRLSARGTATASAAMPAPMSSVPFLRHPPRAVLPDLVAMPSWGISTSHTKTGQDLLDFGATVWIGGRSRLDVVGFRSHASSIMHAYQYFWRNGHIVGRVPAGTMTFDNKKGHHHWHFEQFAAYRLLDSVKKLAVRSHKVGFCITPTDPVDLVLPHAVWRPASVGLEGACGVPTSLSVQEMLPLGWGDTYFQTVAGQSFGITSLPNGTYYIEIIANPLRLLHETTTRNDISLRKVILGGTPGHRTVRVPAWHGLDPEG